MLSFIVTNMMILYITALMSMMYQVLDNEAVSKM